MKASPKRNFILIGGLALSSWLGTAMAQTTTPTPAPGAAPATTYETDTMENYLTNNPRVAEALHNNPSLINNPQWLAQHPQVQTWMNNHPNVKGDAATNPQSFVNQTEHEALNRDRTDLNKTDSFLAQHPGMAKQLNADPKLIDDPKYLAAHPALQQYMNQHPGIANDWKQHPNEFADAARADARYNRNHASPTPAPRAKPAPAPAARK